MSTRKSSSKKKNPTPSAAAPGAPGVDAAAANKPPNKNPGKKNPGREGAASSRVSFPQTITIELPVDTESRALFVCGSFIRPLNTDQRARTLDQLIATYGSREQKQRMRSVWAQQQTTQQASIPEAEPLGGGEEEEHAPIEGRTMTAGANLGV